MRIRFQNHLADPVGTLIGINSTTGGSVSKYDIGRLKETALIIREAGKAALGKETTAHNCYGAGTPDCSNTGLLKNEQPMSWEHMYKQKYVIIPSKFNYK
ncbi:MAG: hypothetical protein Q4D05_08120 [Acinetobacter sp.]|nr:hypothetical protein [Acinetobacter sp.]